MQDVRKRKHERILDFMQVFERQRTQVQLAVEKLLAHQGFDLFGNAVGRGFVQRTRGSFDRIG